MTSMRATPRLLAALALAAPLALPPLAAAQHGYSAREFSWRLFEAVAREKPESNVVLSPTSVAFALGMVRAGARGQTLAEIDSVLGLPATVPDTADPWAPEWMARLTASDSVTLRLANSIWIKPRFRVSRSFLTRTIRDFRAEATTIDLATMDAVNTINHWVDTQSNGMIKEARSTPFPDTTMAVLINVTYFKAGWQQRFDSAATRLQPFHLADGRTRPHPLMRGPCDCPYLETEAFQLVRVPYRGNDFAMYVLLPRPGLRLNAVEAALAADSLTAWRLRLEQTRVALSLPRFRAESSINLNPPLKAIGLDRPFDAKRSDLAGMVEDGQSVSLHVGEAFQKALVEVTEEGTEAAAVTLVPMDVVTSARRTVAMVVDRPFVFIIYHEPTSTPLFIGRILDPE